MSPQTTAGEIACIVYAFFGIPITLIVLADFGKLLVRGLKVLMATRPVQV